MFRLLSKPSRAACMFAPLRALVALTPPTPRPPTLAARRHLSIRRDERRDPPSSPAPGAADPAANPSASPMALLRSLSPQVMMAKINALGPTAVALYGVLWVGPFLCTFAPVALGLLAVPDPLQFLDYYLPMVGDYMRPVVGSIMEVPKPGDPLPPHVQGIVWGFLVNDVLEIPRIMAVFALAPRIKAYLAGGKEAE